MIDTVRNRYEFPGHFTLTFVQVMIIVFFFQQTFVLEIHFHEFLDAFLNVTLIYIYVSL